jgi:hypothetical protein
MSSRALSSHWQQSQECHDGMINSLYDTNVSNLDLQYDESIVSQANKNFVERK